MFEEIKTRVKELILGNKGEITSTTNFKSGGIYMIYVDDFTDEKIIPFYIGQTHDFQDRHKTHFTELLSLNRLRREVYDGCVLDGIYSSQYKSCKIYSYMVDRECKLSDYHMIILEYIDDEDKRMKIEKEYIDSLMAPFFGFNQMNCVSCMPRFIENMRINKQYEKMAQNDYGVLCKYIDYGYCRFNMFVSYPIFAELVTGFKETDMYQKICEIKSAEKEELEIRNFINFGSKEEAWGILGDAIDEFFSNYKMRSEDKKKTAINVLVFEEFYEEQKKSLKTYFKRFKLDFETDFLNVIKKEFKKPIDRLITKIDQMQNERLELEEKIYVGREEYLKPILPQSMHKAYPLGYLHKEYEFPYTEENNICFVNIDYTCFKSNYNYDIYPEICKIKYKFIKDGVVKEGEYFIKNDLTDCLDKEDVYYVPDPGTGFGKRHPYNLWLRGGVGTNIPIKMEYKNGINELLLSENEAIDAKTVFMEIEQLIDEKTKVVYTASGAKNTILNYDMWKDEMMIIRKLQRNCK